MLAGPSGIGCDEVRFSVVGMFDCVKECMSFIVQLII